MGRNSPESCVSFVKLAKGWIAGPQASEMPTSQSLLQASSFAKQMIVTVKHSEVKSTKRIKKVPCKKHVT